ncbi:MAG: HD domain-containing protein [Rhodobacterales bacterium]|nr:HD domain-containing protein [Pseudomonadota bacterium]MDA1285573.1 HD domain-containing protein [Pseudomonadota bacterium]
MSVPDFDTLNASNIVDFIGDIFLRRGAESYLGEDVTMSEHMLQGAFLAEQAGAKDTLIVAALLHDIGHYTNEFEEDAAQEGRDNYHETAGARVLEPYFPKIVTDCVLYHVPAKRYLCATDPEYFGQLSEASVQTLKLQGGPMSAGEVAELDKNPNLQAILQVRRWDDGGKVKDKTTPDFDHYAPMLRRVVRAYARSKNQ